MVPGGLRETLQHYGTEGFKGVSQLGANYAERFEPIGQPILVFTA